MEPKFSSNAEARLDEVLGHRPWSRYSLAAAITLAAVAAQWLLSQIISVVILIILYPAVFFVAWMAGFGPALLATALSVVSVIFLFPTPSFDLAHLTRDDTIRLLIFTTMSILISRFVTRARREEKLSRDRGDFERHKLEAIFQASPAAMALWRGPNIVFELVNPVYQETFPGRKLEGRPFLEALPEFADQQFPGIIRNVYETGRPYIGREVLARHKRSEDSPIEDHYYDFAYVRIDDLDGKPYGVYDHAIDVSDRVLARRDLEDGKRRLQESVYNLEQERSLRERFVATLSHDLRTPLTAAKMSAQILARRAEDPAEVRKLGLRIIESINRSDRMIEDLLDASRLKAGEKLPIEVEACDLRKIASETLDELRTIHGDRFVLRADEPVEGLWSPGGIRRILENLCGNSVKYGAPDRPITVSLRREGASAELRVHNEGPPIPPEIQPTLFEPFKRASVHPKQKGWGLGLALVRGLTEASGGKIRLTSAPGSGTDFVVTLPIKPLKSSQNAA